MAKLHCLRTVIFALTAKIKSIFLCCLAQNYDNKLLFCIKFVVKLSLLPNRLKFLGAEPL